LLNDKRKEERSRQKECHKDSPTGEREQKDKLNYDLDVLAELIKEHILNELIYHANDND
jgi:hypothetical protein